MVNRIILTFSLLFLVSAGLYSQNCDAELIVQKNRSFKSVSTKGAIFTLVLSNTGNSNSTFTLTSKQLSQSCDNGRQLSKKPNSKVVVSFVDATLRSLDSNTITIPRNSSKEIKVRVASLEKQPTNTWGCVEIFAQNTNCKSNPRSVVLSAWILDAESQE